MYPICFYHKSDLDGVCSAAIVKHFVPDCELYGMEYGDEFPWDKIPFASSGPYEGPRTVYMVDFSLPLEQMQRLAKMSNFIWIDHHKQIIGEAHAAGFNPPGLREITYAACELCWVHFDAKNDASGFRTMPETIRLLGTYDSWRKDDPDWEMIVTPFQYGCRALPGIYDPTDSIWPHMLACDTPAERGGAENFIVLAIQTGVAILRFQDTQCRKIASAGAFDLALSVPFHAYSRGSYFVRSIALNTPLFSSQSFEGVYDPVKHDIMVAFAWMATGKWKVSLYSTKPEINCGAIAKTFGGGGHAGAAGFVCDKLPWEDEP